ncbi:collagen alpha-2(I) chain-like [Lontra canadensis]|uniref:collagen alpha-2(I) chain-like n=1 Tax=Lontra canadensis TaxID=76717 RepID=UPI0013F34C86|nr:collagen alpha-2(I) chain-like [Lontra canadensis]
MEVLEKPCGVARGSSESQRMASRDSADGRGSVAKVQLDSAEAPSLPCADAVAAAAAAAAAATAFAATVSAAAVPALPPGGSIVSAVSGPEAGQPSGFRNGRRPTELRHQGAGGTGSGRGQRGNPGSRGQNVGRQGAGVARSAVSGVGALSPRPVFPRRPPQVGSEPRRAPPAMSPDSRWPVSAGLGPGREWPAGED